MTATPAIRHEYFQTPEKITFTFYVKNRTLQDVLVEATERSLRVSIRMTQEEDASSFEYALSSLYAPIRPIVGEDITINVRSMKVEVTVPKVTPAQWPKLEIDAAAVVPTATASAVAAFPATQKDLVYPNSKGRDWNDFKVEDEDEKNLVGDAALNKLFKDIYAKADDDKRRAMMKSFQESGGTCLSTNWEDVGSRTVPCEPPKGMVAQKWEQ